MVENGETNKCLYATGSDANDLNNFRKKVRISLFTTESAANVSKYFEGFKEADQLRNKRGPEAAKPATHVP